MKKIFSIAWNDIKIEFADRSSIVFYLILPIIFTTIIGIALAGTDDGNPAITLPVVDLDQSAAADQLIANLNATDIVSVEEYADETAARAALNESNLAAMLIIPQGFEAKLSANEQVPLQMLVQTSETTMSVEQAVQTAAGQLGYAATIAKLATDAADAVQPFANDEEKVAYQSSMLESAQEALTDPAARTQMTQGATQQVIVANGFSQSSPGQLVTWVLITLLGGSEVFVAERVGGTLRRLMTTPSNKATIITGKILGRFLLGMVQMILLVGFGALVLNVNWGQDPLALAVILVTFGLAGTSLGVMLGAFARTRAQAGGLSVMFSMLLAALGGAWWPMEITPQVYQTVVKALPSTWAMTGLTDVIVRGKTVVDILPAAGILLAFAAVFFIVGVWKLKFE